MHLIACLCSVVDVGYLFTISFHLIQLSISCKNIVHSLYWYSSLKVYVYLCLFMILFLHLMKPSSIFCRVLCWKIRHPKFRRVINLSSCIHWDVYWKTRDFVAYIPCPKLYWTQYFCLRICLGQTRISYYS